MLGILRLTHRTAAERSGQTFTPPEAGQQDVRGGSVEPTSRLKPGAESKKGGISRKLLLLGLTAALALPTVGVTLQSLDYLPSPILASDTATVTPRTLPASSEDFGLTREFSLPGTGSFDHMTFDASSHQLYVTHGNHVQVLNVESGKMNTITSTQSNHTHAVVLVPGTNHGFITNGGSNTVTMFDRDTNKPIKDIQVGGKPDNATFDPVSNLVWVMNDTSQNATAINPATGDVVKTVALGGTPEMARADGHGHLWANLSDKGSVADIDTQTGQVHTYSVDPAANPSPMSIDPATGHLFIGGDNGKAVIFDTNTHQIVGTVAIGDSDNSEFDAKTGQVFFSSSDGTATVIDTHHGNATQTIKTEPGAKSLAIDETTGTTYYPGATQAFQFLNLPGSFHVGEVTQK